MPASPWLRSWSYEPMAQACQNSVVPSVVALCLALKHRVERITARTSYEQQHRAAHNRHIFPEVAGLVNDLCWLRFPIAVRAEGCDDDEQQYKHRRVAGGEADDQQHTA